MAMEKIQVLIELTDAEADLLFAMLDLGICTENRAAVKAKASALRKYIVKECNDAAWARKQAEDALKEASQ